ncbi:hypothetical protein JZ751_021270 [Albula glossodonta]|uniref:Myosin motor domain-containing protein n=1 Tax=Albula glossodonta TaxID=121402 RepID=A0A8T2NLZ5_9TELE|nr:hypothetical protein JZ751_021270 [Albula glossodonta]
MMLQERRPQCFVLSGESGSGKTEACKHIVKHLVSRSTHKSFTLEPKMKHVNCILEAFGHARSKMNDNSSRFMKFLSLQYCEKKTLIGARVYAYVLEKSRLIAMHGQYNFKVFYLMAEGMSPEEKTSVYLNNMQSHRYLSEALPGETASTQSRDRLSALRQAIRALGFSNLELENLFVILSAVLHLGDLCFAPLGDGETASPSDLDQQLLEQVSAMLQVSPEDLGLALTSDVQYFKGDVITRRHTVDMSNFCRDVLAKSIYGRVFSYLVNHINCYLQGQEENSGGGALGGCGWMVNKVVEEGVREILHSKSESWTSVDSKNSGKTDLSRYNEGGLLLSRFSVQVLFSAGGKLGSSGQCCSEVAETRGLVSTPWWLPVEDLSTELTVVTSSGSRTNDFMLAGEQRCRIVSPVLPGNSRHAADIPVAKLDFTPALILPHDPPTPNPDSRLRAPLSITESMHCLNLSLVVLIDPVNSAALETLLASAPHSCYSRKPKTAVYSSSSPAPGQRPPCKRLSNTPRILGTGMTPARVIVQSQVRTVVENPYSILCINISSEKIHQYVTEVLFQQERAECLREGVTMETLHSPGNQTAVLDFFLQTCNSLTSSQGTGKEKLPDEQEETLSRSQLRGESHLLLASTYLIKQDEPEGLMLIMDEESQAQRPAEQNLYRRLQAQLDATNGNSVNSVSLTTKDGNGNPPPQGPSFTITHYAGKMTYDLTGSLERNKDALPQNILFLMKCTLAQAMLTPHTFGCTSPYSWLSLGGPVKNEKVPPSSSENVVIHQLFQSKLTRTGSLVPPRRHLGPKTALFPLSTGQDLQKVLDVRKILQNKGGSSLLQVQERYGPVTMSAQLKNSLSEITNKLKACTPHFVQCIRPNGAKQTDSFDRSHVSGQLQYVGVLEMVRMIRYGYPVRLTFTGFLARYVLFYRNPLPIRAITSQNRPDHPKSRPGWVHL